MSFGEFIHLPIKTSQKKDVVPEITPQAIPTDASTTQDATLPNPNLERERRNLMAAKLSTNTN
jgi:hypothetical protein